MRRGAEWVQRGAECKGIGLYAEGNRNARVAFQDLHRSERLLRKAVYPRHTDLGVSSAGLPRDRVNHRRDPRRLSAPATGGYSGRDRVWPYAIGYHKLICLSHKPVLAPVEAAAVGPCQGAACAEGFSRL